MSSSLSPARPTASSVASVIRATAFLYTRGPSILSRRSACSATIACGGAPSAPRTIGPITPRPPSPGPITAAPAGPRARAPSCSPRRGARGAGRGPASRLSGGSVAMGGKGAGPAGAGSSVAGRLLPATRGESSIDELHVGERPLREPRENPARPHLDEPVRAEPLELEHRLAPANRPRQALRESQADGVERLG